LRFDANQSGALDLQEWKASGISGTEKLAFESYDLDRDGEISGAEFSTILTAWEPRRFGGARQALPTEVASVDKPRAAQVLSPRLTGPPNLILVSMDTVRADRLSLYGHTAETTPFLEDLAALGTVFERAFSVSNESAYAHAAMLTGRYASEVHAPVYTAYMVPEEATTLPEILKAHGYETGAYLAGGHVTEDFGFDQGFDDFSSEKGYASFWHTRQKALRWLDGRSGESPWFLMLHGYDAHMPYDTPEPFSRLFVEGVSSSLADKLAASPQEAERVFEGKYYADAQMDWTKHASGAPLLDPVSYSKMTRLPSDGGVPLSQAEIEQVRAHYDSTLAYLDLQLGLFFETARARGYLENTVVIITGDHGEDLFDHGFANHRTTLTDSCVRVPLLAFGPGVPKGRRVSDIVDLLDIVPTMLDFAGATPLSNADGRALFEDQASGEPVVFFEGVRPMVGVRTASHKLILNGVLLTDPSVIETIERFPLRAPQAELYDLQKDPGEQHNLLAGVPSDLALAEQLRGRVVDWRRALRPPLKSRSSLQIDADTRKTLQAHGYWEFGVDSPALAPVD